MLNRSTEHFRATISPVSSNLYLNNDHYIRTHFRRASQGGNVCKKKNPVLTPLRLTHLLNPVVEIIAGGKFHLQHVSSAVLVLQVLCRAQTPGDG